jgi:hypothetical protein
MATQMRRDILGLSKHERQLFLLIPVGQEVSPAFLTRRAGRPRTSIVRSLWKLHSRGFVKSVKKGKRTLWERRTFARVEESISEDFNAMGFAEVGGTADGFRLLHGIDSLASTLEHLLQKLPRNGQFRGVQPTRSALVLTRKVGVSRIIAINNLIKNKDIIVKGVLEEDFLVSLNSEFGRGWLESFAGRLAHTSFVPKEYMRYGADLYLIGNQAMIANWESELGVVIDNGDIVALLKSMHEFMHDAGNRIDNNELAKLLL